MQQKRPPQSSGRPFNKKKLRVVLLILLFLEGFTHQECLPWTLLDIATLVDAVEYRVESVENGTACTKRTLVVGRLQELENGI